MALYRWKKSTVSYTETSSFLSNTISANVVYRDNNKPSAANGVYTMPSSAETISADGYMHSVRGYFTINSRTSNTLYYANSITFNSSGSSLIATGQYTQYTQTATEGTEQGYVYSTDSSAYPNGGVSGGYYYSDMQEIAPPVFTNLPQLVMQGNQITVSWSAVDGADGYILERKADTDADWTQVYSGANTSFEETVGTWTSVQYRVKAGVSGTYGDYTTSASVPVVSASAVVISGTDGDLGTLVNDVTYTVSSYGSTELTVVETINGTETRTFTATNGGTNKIPVVDLPTGYGTIKITASTNPGSGVVTVTREWTYTKAAITFPDAGSVADLTQQGKTIWAKTIAEAVRAPGIWGGNLGLALAKLAGAVLYNPNQVAKYTEVKVSLAGKSEGDIISLPENGKMVEFYVAKLDYESGLNGTGRTLLVRKDLYIARPWDAGGVNAYSASDIDIWMESTYKPMLHNSVQSEIGTTKIYYTPGNGNDAVTTIERGVFPLSATEMGGAEANFNVEGTVLPISETLQQASNGPQNIQWTRTPTIGRTDTAISLSRNPNPSFDNTFCTATQKWYYRPAFTLPSTFTATYYVGSDGTVHDEQEYEEAGTFTDISGGAIPMVSIETGSYVGTGALGNANPSSLTFSAPPAFLLISNGGASHFILMDVVALTTSFTARAYLYVETDGALKTTSTVYAKRDGNTVSWYIDEAKPYAQCNQQGLAYTYLALLGGAA